MVVSAKLVSPERMSSMKFTSYELVPADVQERLLKEYEEQTKDEA